MNSHLGLASSNVFISADKDDTMVWTLNVEEFINGTVGQHNDGCRVEDIIGMRDIYNTINRRSIYINSGSGWIGLWGQRQGDAFKVPFLVWLDSP